LLLSDLGRQTYLDVLDADNADALFDAAIDALIALQRIDCPADLPRYDAVLLRRELELFPEWYLQRHLGLTIDAKLRVQLDEVFELLIEHALQQSRVLVHRDFMPRNLMVSEPNPGVLDFQDAVCGPISYDPICLFKDAFISWPEERVEKWLRRYWQRGLAVGLSLPSTFEQFYTDCDFMGAQRHLKVIGIFARICYRDGKDKYLADVPRFFAYLRGAISRQPALVPLGALLDQLPGAA
jgi:N-acetylmuramate 1-kinase